MKKKGIVALIVCMCVGTGSIYGAYIYSRKTIKPVEVVSVASLSSGSMGFDFGDSSETSYGSIVTRNGQVVSLDTEKKLSKVYVEQGDKVKVGDKLLEYDMTLTDLQREMENLNGQMLQINEYTKDMPMQHEIGEKVRISFNPAAVSLYSKETGEVLSL